MAKVEIYTSAFCPFCYRAKHLLDQKGVAYDEIDVTFSPGKRAEPTWLRRRHLSSRPRPPRLSPMRSNWRRS